MPFRRPSSLLTASQSHQAFVAQWNMISLLKFQLCPNSSLSNSNSNSSSTSNSNPPSSIPPPSLGSSWSDPVPMRLLAASEAQTWAFQKVKHPRRPGTLSLAHPPITNHQRPTHHQPHQHHLTRRQTSALKTPLPLVTIRSLTTVPIK